MDALHRQPDRGAAGADLVLDEHCHFGDAVARAVVRTAYLVSHRRTGCARPDRRAEGRAGAVEEIRRLRRDRLRSEEHTSELQSLMRISYAVFCLKKKNHQEKHKTNTY